MASINPATARPGQEERLSRAAEAIREADRLRAIRQYESFPGRLSSARLYPSLADRLEPARAGQCWASPKEMKEMAESVYYTIPHGTVETITIPPDWLCPDVRVIGQRIWHDRKKLWLNT